MNQTQFQKAAGQAPVSCALVSHIDAAMKEFGITAVRSGHVHRTDGHESRFTRWWKLELPADGLEPCNADTASVRKLGR
jgi:predicted chitinase